MEAHLERARGLLVPRDIISIRDRTLCLPQLLQTRLKKLPRRLAMLLPLHLKTTIGMGETTETVTVFLISFQVPPAALRLHIDYGMRSCQQCAFHPSMLIKPQREHFL